MQITGSSPSQPDPSPHFRPAPPAPADTNESPHGARKPAAGDESGRERRLGGSAADLESVSRPRPPKAWVPWRSTQNASSSATVEAGQDEPRDDRHGRIDRRVGRLVRHMAHDVRDVVRDFAKGFEDHDTRKGVERMDKDFRREVKEALHGMRHGELSPEDVLAAVQSAVERLTASLEQLGVEAAPESEDDASPTSQRLSITYTRATPLTLEAEVGNRLDVAS